MKSGQNCPDREDYVLADRGNYVQFAAGIKFSNEKSFNIIWLLINKLNELSENILRKIVKKTEKTLNPLLCLITKTFQREEQNKVLINFLT